MQHSPLTRLCLAAAAAATLGSLLAGVNVGTQVANGSAALHRCVDRRLGVQPIGQHPAQVEDASVLARRGAPAASRAGQADGQA